jgi:hypothetical protein
MIHPAVELQDIIQHMMRSLNKGKTEGYHAFELEYHRSLQLSRGTRFEAPLRSMGGIVHKLVHEEDKTVIPGILSQLRAIVDWLGSLEVIED